MKKKSIHEMVEDRRIYKCEAIEGLDPYTLMAEAASRAVVHPRTTLEERYRPIIEMVDPEWRREFVEFLPAKRRASRAFIEACESEPSLSRAMHAYKLEKEYETLGYYISGHPLADFRPAIGFCQTCDPRDIVGLPGGSPCWLGGVIRDVELRQTKSGRSRGQALAKFRLESFGGAAICIAWAEVYSRFCRLIDDRMRVFAFGTTIRKEIFEDEYISELSVSSVIPISRWPGLVRSIVATFDAYSQDAAKAAVRLCRSRPGRVEFALRFGNGRAIRNSAMTEYDPATVRDLCLLAGPENVRIVSASGRAAVVSPPPFDSPEAAREALRVVWRDHGGDAASDDREERECAAWREAMAS